MAMVALSVVSYLAYLGDEACKGALITVISASIGFFLRGKVVTPDSTTGVLGSATVNVSQPSSGETVVNVPGPDTKSQ